MPDDDAPAPPEDDEAEAGDSNDDVKATADDDAAAVESPAQAPAETTDTTDEPPAPPSAEAEDAAEAASIEDRAEADDGSSDTSSLPPDAELSDAKLVEFLEVDALVEQLFLEQDAENSVDPSRTSDAADLSRDDGPKVDSPEHIDSMAESDSDAAPADARPPSVEPSATDAPTPRRRRRTKVTATRTTISPVVDGASSTLVDAQEALSDGSGPSPASTESILGALGPNPEAAPAFDVTRRHLRGLLEALLFVADGPMKSGELAEIARSDAREVRSLLEEIAANYRDESRGFQLDELAGGWQFRTNPTFAPFVREVTAQKPVKLSRAQIETLAIVAYRQPITRPEIEDIRGVDAGAVLKLLLERDLVRVLGKKDEPGRPLLYGTTSQFLTFFGLKALRDLPTLREFTELSDESREVMERELEQLAEVAAEKETKQVGNAAIAAADVDPLSDEAKTHGPEGAA